LFSTDYGYFGIEKGKTLKDWSKQRLLDEIIDPLAKIARRNLMYRRDYKNGVKYSGFPLYGKIAVTNLQPAERLSKKGIEKEEEQGRDLLYILLMIAFQLGSSAKEYELENEPDTLQKLMELRYKMEKERR
jgi:hypothetical protein